MSKKYCSILLIVSLVLNLITIPLMIIILSGNRSPAEAFLKKVAKETTVALQFTEKDILFFHETENNPFGERNKAIIAKICDANTKKYMNQLVGQNGWKDLATWDDRQRDEILGSINDSQTFHSIPTEMLDSAYANYLLPNSNRGYAYLYISDENSEEIHRYILIEYLDNIDVVSIFSFNAC